MRKTIITWIAVLACLSGVALLEQANAAEIGDELTLGYFIPGLPNGDNEATTYLTQLIAMEPGDDPVKIVINKTENLIIRENTTFPFVLPAPPVMSSLLEFANEWEGVGTTAIDLGEGFAYLTAKYGGGKGSGGTVVWVVAGLTPEGGFEIPTTWNGNGLSGVRLWNRVPEGGMTVLLLGCALSALGLARRRLS